MEKHDRAHISVPVGHHQRILTAQVTGSTRMFARHGKEPPASEF